MIILTLTLFFLELSSSAALAANIVIDKQSGPSEPGLFHTPNYANDAACVQAALEYSKSGDTITISEGDYYITKGIVQKDKSLNIIGEGNVTLHIQTSDKEINEIYFGGSVITSNTLYADAKIDSSQVVLTDASQVRQNDLIKIWKNVQWCPLDYPDNYPDQMTGEMYAVKSVNGNVVTLNQPLLRDYSLSEGVQVEVYRPVQVHVRNIRIEDTGETMLHHGLVMQYCKDSSITDSWFKDSGFGAICLYSCFNVSVNNNEIYNSLHPGCGYGVNAASGSAFINIENNHIENCRHAITANSAELKSLNRDVFIADNTLIGASIVGSNVVDAHADTINFVVTRNKIYPQISFDTPNYYAFYDYRYIQELPYYFAFSDGTQQSVFSNNEVFGGFGGIFKRGAVNDGVHIYENNIFNGISGNMYEGGNGTDDILIIRNNTQNSGMHGVVFPFYGSVRNILISENTFSNLSHQGVYQKFLIDGVNLDISNNAFSNIKLDGVYIDGNSFTNGDVKIQNNILTNVNISNSSSGITIKNIQNAIINGNKILEVSEQPLSGEPLSEEPLSEEPLSEEPVSPEIEISDNRLRESSPDTVYQSSPFIDIGGRDNVRYRDVMWFDLSKYNSESQVDNAILSLFWYYPARNTRFEDTVIEIYRPAYAWNSNYLSWSKRDKGVAWKKLGGDWYDKNGVLQGSTPYATLTFKGSDFPDNRYYELDVTDLVKEYTSGKYKNTGFLIKARTESNDYIAFYSSDCGNESQVPKLQLNTFFVQNGRSVSSGLKEDNLLQAFFSSMTVYYKDIKEGLFADFC
ncbi:disaggregatase related repeat-containing protein [Methanosarcina sp.]|uniref:disaggregatase related repeat-containing protein n=1 Tax=Methanosarcina sp. TaxID=2213 RepID=UPI003BB5D2B0